MELRTLGHTGVKVSPLCLGAMMFGAWGETDHDKSIEIIHRALDAGHQLHRHRRRLLARRVGGDRRQGAGGRPPRRRDPRDQGARHRWATTPTSSATRAAGSSARSRTACAGSAPTGSTSTRSTAPSRTPTSTRRSARSPTSCAQGKVRYIGSSTFPASQIVEAQWTAERRGRERFVCEQPPYSLLVRGIEARRAADGPAPPHGRDRLEPAGRRLAVRQVAQGRRRPDLAARGDDPEALRPVDPRQPAQARRRRRARPAGRGGRADADRDGARVRDPPPGGHRGDHRPAHDGAPRVAARRRGRRAVRRRARPHRRDRAARREREPDRRAAGTTRRSSPRRCAADRAAQRPRPVADRRGHAPRPRRCTTRSTWPS